MNSQKLTDKERQAFLTRMGAYDLSLSEPQRQAIREEWPDEQIVMALHLGG